MPHFANEQQLESRIDSFINNNEMKRSKGTLELYIPFINFKKEGRYTIQ
jgi:hypothetical protein